MTQKIRAMYEPAIWLCTVGLLLLCWGTGCAAEPPDPVDLTAQQRRAAPPEVGPLLIRGQEALRAGAYHTALVLVDSAGAYAPALADVPFLRGRILTELGRLQEARAAYEQVLALDPGYRGARLNLGNVAQRQGQHREALDHYRQEQARFPAAVVLVEMGGAREALGETAQARAAYEEALRLDSTNARAYMRLGQLYEADGAFEEAMACTRHGVRLDPENVDYRYVLGYQLHRAGRHAEAVRMLEAVVARQPWHRGAHYNLGKALVHLGRGEEGARYLAEARRLQEEQGRLNELQAAAELNPADPARWVALGGAFYAAGRLAEAARVLEVARVLTPGDPALQNNLANLALARGDTAGAIRRYEAILSRSPAAGEVWLNLGVAYARSGDTARARQAWEQAARHSTDAATARRYLAQLAR